MEFFFRKKLRAVALIRKDFFTGSFLEILGSCSEYFLVNASVLFMSSQSSYSASQIHLLVHSSPKSLNIWHIRLKKKTLYNHLSIDVSEDVNGEVQFL